MSQTAGKDFADHHDAELVLRAYELRREPVLREARKAIMMEWWPTSLEDLTAVAAWGHEKNAAFRQVTGYWELIYGMARHGIVHAEYLADSSGAEALILLAKVRPWLTEFRALSGPHFLRNTEWIATETATGREMFQRVEARVAQLRGTR